MASWLTGSDAASKQASQDEKGDSPSSPPGGLAEVEKQTKKCHKVNTSLSSAPAPYLEPEPSELEKLREKNRRLQSENESLMMENRQLGLELGSSKAAEGGSAEKHARLKVQNDLPDASPGLSAGGGGHLDSHISSDLHTRTRDHADTSNAFQPTHTDRSVASMPSLYPTASMPSLHPSASKIDLEDPDVKMHTQWTSMGGESSLNRLVLAGSALGQSGPVQAIIYLLALGGVCFVLYAQSTHLGASDYESEGDDGAHRRLGGAVDPVLVHIAFCLLCAALVGLIVNFIKQPLILGYLLAGVLVGPIGLKIIEDHKEISTLSSLGLVFLLFMVGLELDVKELLKMGKVVLLTGFCQFPICAGAHIGIFMGLQSAGLSFGEGQLASLYCGLVTGISSTMIVVKLLSAKCDTDSQPGRLTIGILIFQDVWAIIVLAIQPNMDSPEVTGILKTFGMIAVLLEVAILYAKFVMPAVLFTSSKNVELMLVLALGWCFFICCIAVLPFIGLGMELASLIAGVALATFPYSAEFNGKIKYIRDFFITLFFIGLGMQIPVPTLNAILKGALIAVVVLTIRWVGIFSVARLLGAKGNLATVATINLSQISEFALVICSLGMGYGHIEQDTLTIIIWCFAILAISSSYLINSNRELARFLRHMCTRCRGRKPQASQGEEDESSHGDRDIVFLGFHNIAAMIFAYFASNNKDIIQKLHVIDFDEGTMKMLEEKGIKCSYGDISAADVLEHSHHGECNLVVCTIPDSLLQGTNNAQLLKVASQVWPKAKVIVTAESSGQAQQLYLEGAAYVLRIEKLCAFRLGELINTHVSTPFGGGELDVFHQFRQKDNRRGFSTLFRHTEK